MKFKSFFSVVASVCFATGLLLTPGCGGSEGGGGEAGGTSDISALEAKAAQGDGAAAFKIGEILSANSEKPAARTEALKWFYIAQKLGNTDSALAISALQRGADVEMVEEAKMGAQAFKVSAPQK